MDAQLVATLLQVRLKWVTGRILDCVRKIVLAITAHLRLSSRRPTRPSTGSASRSFAIVWREERLQSRGLWGAHCFARW
jgi:hypothetical protein